MEDVTVIGVRLTVKRRLVVHRLRAGRVRYANGHGVVAREYR